MSQTQQQQQEEEDGNQLNLSNEDDSENISSDSQAFGSFFDLIYRGVRRCAATSVGVFVIDKISQVLQIVEKTAKWSLPVQVNTVETVSLERPLPWVPFLALIMSLRTIQLILSLGAITIGNYPIQAMDIVEFIQTRRRKLEAMRLYACRAIYQREMESWTRILRKLFSKLICSPHLDSSEAMAEPINNERKKTNLKRVLKRSRHTEESSNESQTFTHMLEKYAAEDSTKDSDFICPSIEMTDATYNSTSALVTLSSSDESGKSILQNQRVLPNKSNNFNNVAVKENGDSYGGDGKDPNKLKELIRKTQQEILFEDSCSADENKMKLNGSLLDCDESDRSKDTPRTEIGLNIPMAATAAAAAIVKPLLIRQKSIIDSSFHRT